MPVAETVGNFLKDVGKFAMGGGRMSSVRAGAVIGGSIGATYGMVDEMFTGENRTGVVGGAFKGALAVGLLWGAGYRGGLPSKTQVGLSQAKVVSANVASTGTKAGSVLGRAGVAVGSGGAFRAPNTVMRRGVQGRSPTMGSRGPTRPQPGFNAAGNPVTRRARRMQQRLRQQLRQR